MEHPAGGTLLACIQRINELEGRAGSDFDEDGSSECCSTSSSATAPSASESSYLTDSKRFVPPPGAVAERVARNAHLHNGVNVLRKGSSDVAPACYEYVTSGGSFRVDDLCNVTRLMTRIPEDHKAEDVHETLELLAAAAGAVSKGRLSPAVPPDVRGKVTILALDVKLRLLGFDDFPFAPTLEDLCLDKETMNAKFAESNLAPPSQQRDEEYATARRDGCRDGMMGFEYDSRTSKAAIKTMRVYANAWASAEAVCVDLRLRRRLPYLLCRQRYRELPLSERASGDILLKIAGASATTFPTKVLHKVLKYV